MSFPLEKCYNKEELEKYGIKEFNQKFNINILNLYNIEGLMKEKKLIIEKECLMINEKYFYTSNEILLNFI